MAINKATGKKYKEGYNARMDESLGQRRGPARDKKMTYKGRRNVSFGQMKKTGQRKYKMLGTMGYNAHFHTK